MCKFRFARSISAEFSSFNQIILSTKFNPLFRVIVVVRCALSLIFRFLFFNHFWLRKSLKSTRNPLDVRGSIKSTESISISRISFFVFFSSFRSQSESFKPFAAFPPNITSLFLPKCVRARFCFCRLTSHNQYLSNLKFRLRNLIHNFSNRFTIQWRANTHPSQCCSLSHISRKPIDIFNYACCCVQCSRGGSFTRSVSQRVSQSHIHLQSARHTHTYANSTNAGPMHRNKFETEQNIAQLYTNRSGQNTSCETEFKFYLFFLFSLLFFSWRCLFSVSGNMSEILMNRELGM